MISQTTAPITEAQRQVLIALIELDEPFETPNNTHYSFYPKTLEEAKKYFLNLLEDWNQAYMSLTERGVLEKKPNGFSLTPAGIELARKERLDHPPIWYWYREYYTMTSRSLAYSDFCEQLYGRDLCQTNFSDLVQIDFLIRQIEPKPDLRILELGCGKGLFAEYLSDRTGVKVLGIDYVPEAVSQASDRTFSKRNRLEFIVANFDHMDEIKGPFDVIISIDTLYMPSNLDNTLQKIHNLLSPGGQILAYYSEMLFDPHQPREILTANGSTLAKALQKLALTYNTWDFSEATFHLLRKKHELVEKMSDAFQSEGTMFLYHHLKMESDGSTTPFDPATSTVSRYLYQVTG